MSAQTTTKRLAILRDALQMAWHNLYCYSEDWQGTHPKDGYRDLHAKTCSEIATLEAWIQELEGEYGIPF